MLAALCWYHPQRGAASHLLILHHPVSIARRTEEVGMATSVCQESCTGLAFLSQHPETVKLVSQRGLVSGEGGWVQLRAWQWL